MKSLLQSSNKKASLTREQLMSAAGGLLPAYRAKPGDDDPIPGGNLTYTVVQTSVGGFWYDE